MVFVLCSWMSVSFQDKATHELPSLWHDTWHFCRVFLLAVCFEKHLKSQAHANPTKTGWDELARDFGNCGGNTSWIGWKFPCGSCHLEFAQMLFLSGY